jgi:hypothetical protein
VKGRQRRRQEQAPDQQVRRQAQHGGGFAQFGLGVAHADQGVQGDRHHHRLDQHHQLEQLADAEEQHEQRNPGQGRDLRQGTKVGSTRRSARRLKPSQAPSARPLAMPASRPQAGAAG